MELCGVFNNGGGKVCGKWLCKCRWRCRQLRASDGYVIPIEWNMETILITLDVCFLTRCIVYGLCGAVPGEFETWRRVMVGFTAFCASTVADAVHTEIHNHFSLRIGHCYQRWYVSPRLSTIVFTCVHYFSTIASRSEHKFLSFASAISFSMFSFCFES